MPRKSFPAALKAAFPHTVPILTGYLAVGLAYGLLMSSKGYNFLWSGFVSAFAFCGSMQYVAITLLTTAFDPLSAFFLSLMVNARHLFFSLALLPKYRGLGRLRYFLIYTLSDENFSLSSTVGLEEPAGLAAQSFDVHSVPPHACRFALSLRGKRKNMKKDARRGVPGVRYGLTRIPAAPAAYTRRCPPEWTAACCASTGGARR